MSNNILQALERQITTNNTNLTSLLDNNTRFRSVLTSKLDQLALQINELIKIKEAIANSADLSKNPELQRNIEELDKIIKTQTSIIDNLIKNTEDTKNDFTSRNNLIDQNMRKLNASSVPNRGGKKTKRKTKKRNTGKNRNKKGGYNWEALSASSSSRKNKKNKSKYDPSSS